MSADDAVDEALWESSSEEGSSGDSSDSDFDAGGTKASRRQRGRRRTRGGRGRNARDGSSNSSADEDAAPASAQQLGCLAAGLHELFGGLDPDVEFGIFKAFFAPQGAHELSGKALVQIDLSHLRNAPSQAIHLVLEKQQVSTLRDVRGGDEARLVVLSGDMGIKLLGRQAPQHGHAVVEALLSAIATAKNLVLKATDNVLGGLGTHAANSTAQT